MAVYFDLAFVKDSPVQNPEKLYREPRLMVLLAACSIMLVVTTFVQLPWLAEVFPKSGVHEEHLQNPSAEASPAGVKETR
jgi:hypothetical protein